MKESNQKVAEATEKVTNQELVKEIKNKEEVIVMNDRKEVKGTGAKKTLAKKEKVNKRKVEDDWKQKVEKLEKELAEKERQIVALEERIQSLLDDDEANALSDVIIWQGVDIHDLQFRVIELICKDSQYIVDRTYEEACEIIDVKTGRTILNGELCDVHNFLETILKNNIPELKTEDTEQETAEE